MIGGSWRRHGVYRITIEIPLPTWTALVREAERLALRPTQLLRAVLAERFHTHFDEPTPPGGQEPPK